jgi:tripartite ATP-independent transporter DctM subunit
MSVELITVIFFVSIFAAIMSGFPIAITLGAVGLIIGYFTMGEPVFELMYQRGIIIALNYPLLALPLFVLMGIILADSGVADGMYNALSVILGKLRGGLAVTTVLLGAMLAACLGVITAAVSTLTILAVGPMVRRGYSKSLATGAACAGGVLGILIPPSVMIIILGPLADISVGQLFMGAFMPGFMLAGLYSTYIIIRALIQPQIAPGVPAEELGVSNLTKLKLLGKGVVPPLMIILSVLGVIFLGIAPPTEAAATGVIASIALATAYRRLQWDKFKKSLLEAMRVTSFSLCIAFFSIGMVGVFLRIGCGHVVRDIVLSAPGGRWGAFAIIMLVIFLLGFLMSWLPILFIMVPIVFPILPQLGFDEVWFAIMICVNLQMAFMTPPMAQAIFVCRGTVPKELGVETGDIIRGVFPFVGIIIVGLILCVIFPQIILWLPNTLVRTGW